MTLYVLPDGTQAELVPNVALHDPALVYVDHSSLGLIAIDRDKLTEVPPSLPEEPPNGTVFSDGERAVVRRDDPEIDADGRWYFTGDDDYHQWEWIAGEVLQGAWRRMVPDPSDHAPSLPFDIWSDGEREVLVEPSEAWADRVFVNADKAHLDVKHARQLAAALWAWAISRPDSTKEATDG